MIYGGNTSCVEVRAGPHCLILDAGSGLRLLGKKLMQEQVSHATLLLSHFHLDHIAGLPFFGPAFHPRFWLDVVAAPARSRHGEIWNIQTVLALQMESPLFPVPLDDMGCAFRFKSICPGDRFSIGGEVEIKTTALNHPGGATAYRINYRGRSLAYVTDTEHQIDGMDQNILALIHGCDVVIYDPPWSGGKGGTCSPLKKRIGVACPLGDKHNLKESIRKWRQGGTAPLPTLKINSTQGDIVPLNPSPRDLSKGDTSPEGTKDHPIPPSSSPLPSYPFCR